MPRRKEKLCVECGKRKACYMGYEKGRRVRRRGKGHDLCRQCFEAFVDRLQAEDAAKKGVC